MQNSMKTGTASADATFDRLDRNHDGKLSSTEAAADSKVQGIWKKLDADNNGTVTKAEFEAHASDLK
jgi:Ca2+-binding EF-hand superfamily protein